MITNVSGRAGKFDAQCETDGDDFRTAQVTFTAEVNSITTGQPQRDAHLMGDDFFNAEKFPQIKFTSTKVEHGTNDSFTLYGDLTIRDVTKQVKLDVEYGGIVADAYGNTKAGFTVTGKINRKEFGLKWNMITDAGSIVAGDDVKIHCEIQLSKVKEQQ